MKCLAVWGWLVGDRNSVGYIVPEKFITSEVTKWWGVIGIGGRGEGSDAVNVKWEWCIIQDVIDSYLHAPHELEISTSPQAQKKN